MGEKKDGWMAFLFELEIFILISSLASSFIMELSGRKMKEGRKKEGKKERKRDRKKEGRRLEGKERGRNEGAKEGVREGGKTCRKAGR